MAKNDKSNIPADVTPAHQDAQSLVTRAAAAELVAQMNDPTQLAAPASEEMIRRMIEEADYVAPRFVKLKEGDILQDVLYTGVSTMPYVDKTTGEVKPVKCHSFARGKLTAWTMGAYELDLGLGGVAADGTMLVTIFRGFDKRIPTGRIVSNYQVTARRAPKGTPVIDVQESPK